MKNDLVAHDRIDNLNLINKLEEKEGPGGTGGCIYLCGRHCTILYYTILYTRSPFLEQRKPALWGGGGKHYPPPSRTTAGEETLRSQWQSNYAQVLALFLPDSPRRVAVM